MSYKKERRRYKGKIGWCDNKYLPLMQSKAGGHYVYIRSVRNGRADVQVITSLEYAAGKGNSSSSSFNPQRIAKVKSGLIYPIPKPDSNFGRWSGIDRTVLKDIDVTFIQNVGSKWIRKKHRFGIAK